MEYPQGDAAHTLNKPDIERELAEKPFAFDFFQAIRLLENLHPEKPRLGKGARAQDDFVRLEQNVSLAFQASTLTGFQHRKAYPAPHLTTAFFGLFGPNGGLPLHLSEYAYERSKHHGDETFIRFVNLFQHRMLSFMYRAWANAQPTVNFDRPDKDRFKYYIGSFLGLGMDSLQARDAISDNLKLHFAAHFACQTKHPEGLKFIIENYFKLATRIEEFVGAWLALPEDSICRLGKSRQTGSLGINAIAGARIWSKQHKFRIRLGAMALPDYQKLLNDTLIRKRLISIVHNYIGFELDWDVQMILKHDQVPPLQLGAKAQLGWSCWLGDRKSRCDADDLIMVMG